jgi:hypothetical protein
VFAVCVYLIVLFHFKRSSDLNQIQWDMETITPGDYTCQLEISQKAFNFFMTNIYARDQSRKSDISIGESLKAYIKRELEQILTQKLDEVKEEQKREGKDNITATQVKIADIVFAFNNAELIQLLRTRGQHIV